MAHKVIGLLQMQRSRIMQRRADAGFIEFLFERFAVAGLHDIKVIDRFGPGRFLRRGNFVDLFEGAIIQVGYFPTTPIPLVEIL